MKSIHNIKIVYTATIREALKIINNGALQIALVVDENDILFGTLTDGDIRRGLLNNLSLDDVIDSIVFKTPTVATLGMTNEEIFEKALKHRLHKIPIINDKGQIIGIKEIEEFMQPSIKPNKVVLMVGGLGSRLYPLTKEIPKPMLKVGGKPIIQTIIEKFRDYGFVNIIMCVNYKSEIIQNYFGDGSHFGVHIEYVFENRRMGTAGALSLLQNVLTEPFFVMNGDLLTSVNFEHLLAYHTESYVCATMCVREYNFQVPYGVVNIDGEAIISIEEKPIQKFFVSAGIYMLNPQVINYIPKNQFFDMPTLFEVLIKNSKKTLSFPIHEYWLDIGRMEEYERANREYTQVF